MPIIAKNCPTDIQIQWLSQRFKKDETKNECFIAYTYNNDVFTVESVPYFDLQQPYKSTLAIAWDIFIFYLQQYDNGYKLILHDRQGKLRVRAVLDEPNQAVTSISLLTNK